MEYNFSLELPSQTDIGKRIPGCRTIRIWPVGLVFLRSTRRNCHGPGGQSGRPTGRCRSEIHSYGTGNTGNATPEILANGGKRDRLRQNRCRSNSFNECLFAEYGLTYSNDWFLLPYELEVNTLCEIKGLIVKDVFGMHTYIRAAIDDPEADWQSFAAFHHTEHTASATTAVGRNRLYLVPAVGKLMKAEPLEKVNFMRTKWPTWFGPSRTGFLQRRVSART